MSSKAISLLANSKFHPKRCKIRVDQLQRSFRRGSGAIHTTAVAAGAVTHGEKYFQAWIVIPTEYKARNIKVSVGKHGGFLRVVGRRKAPSRETGKSALRERFRFVYKVEGKVDTQKLAKSARAVLLKSGILKIRLPKDQSFGGVKKVPIDDCTELRSRSIDVETIVDLDQKGSKSEKSHDSTNNFENNGFKSAVMTEKTENTRATKRAGQVIARRVAVSGVRLGDLNVDYDNVAKKLRVAGVRRLGPATPFKSEKRFEKTVRLRPMERHMELDKLSAKLDHGVATVTVPTNGKNSNNCSEGNTGASQKYNIPVVAKLGKSSKNKAEGEA